MKETETEEIERYSMDSKEKKEIMRRNEEEGHTEFGRSEEESIQNERILKISAYF